MPTLCPRRLISRPPWNASLSTTVQTQQHKAAGYDVGVVVSKNERHSPPSERLRTCPGGLLSWPPRVLDLHGGLKPNVVVGPVPRGV